MTGDELSEGAVAAELEDELGTLGVAWIDVEAAGGKSTDGLRQHLALLSQRVRGPQALLLRQAPIPYAYRVFFRNIGLDPDVERPPAEAAIYDRIVKGGYISTDLVADACLVALVETNVPVWALDAAVVSGPLSLRLSRAGETVGRGETVLPVAAERIVVADDRGPLLPLFETPAGDLAVDRKTVHTRLFAVRVEGVPTIHVEEALWTAVASLEPHSG